MKDLKSVCGRSCACWHRDRGSGGGCFHGMFCNDKVVMWFLVGIVLTRGRGVVPIIYFLSSIDHYHFFTAAFPTPPNSHRRRESNSRPLWNRRKSPDWDGVNGRLLMMFVGVVFFSLFKVEILRSSWDMFLLLLFFAIHRPLCVFPTLFGLMDPPIHRQE